MLMEEAAALLALPRIRDDTVTNFGEKRRIRRGGAAMDTIAVAGGGLAGWRQLHVTDIARLGLGVRQQLQPIGTVPGDEAQSADLALV